MSRPETPGERTMPAPTWVFTVPPHAGPAIVAAGTGVIGASRALPVLRARGFDPVPPCLFHLLTGQPCPFCGLTRSFVATAHLHLRAAVHVYPLGPVLFALVAALTVIAAWSSARGRPLAIRVPRSAVPAALALLAVALAANWASKLLLLGY